MFALTATLALSLLTTVVHSYKPTFDYESSKVRGVNVGGWLVLEPWITPSLFENTGNEAIVDEYTFGQLQDPAVAKAKLQAHWDTFITELDFIEIANAGLNHVRLPIGYWAWDVSHGEPYIQGQIPYLEKAVGWAEKHNLKLIVDLHGVPGSQNGFDNSGQRMDYPQWQTSQENIERAEAVIKTISGLFKDKAKTVSVIAPVNEPAGFYGDEVLKATRQYMDETYPAIRNPWADDSSRESDQLVLYHDAFMNISYFNDFATNEDGSAKVGVALDTHMYQIFSPEEVGRTLKEHIDVICGKKDTKEAQLGESVFPTIAGEWTPAFTDCAKFLNGRGKGARFDGSFPGSTKIDSCDRYTGSGMLFSEDYKIALRKFWEAQVIAFERVNGWIQWTWKAEQADDWSYQAGLRYGWIPQDPTDLNYPTLCD
ncbi:glycoside hydrolase family 5 protein [Cylindrobasidium torrendii FP15055 ss-10]|uniref:Glycoside hydrolase family 5 protein n=1 Tax=Cylindrobasidium torrendii FP15055 ss-10 TaxID=1314674 RepID=A0A0D7BB85_9AGAR|nr:glycoside hydrolase family 5 protein [Cylindrobasidium torrendii FP15055 ss-10]